MVGGGRIKARLARLVTPPNGFWFGAGQCHSGAAGGQLVRERLVSRAHVSHLVVDDWVMLK